MNLRSPQLLVNSSVDLASAVFPAWPHSAAFITELDESRTLPLHEVLRRAKITLEKAPLSVPYMRIHNEASVACWLACVVLLCVRHRRWQIISFPICQLTNTHAAVGVHVVAVLVSPGRPSAHCRIHVHAATARR